MPDTPTPKPTIEAMKAAEKILLALGCNAAMRRMVALEIDSWIGLPALLACAEERDKLKAELHAVLLQLDANNPVAWMVDCPPGCEYDYLIFTDKVTPWDYYDDYRADVENDPDTYKGWTPTEPVRLLGVPAKGNDNE